MAELNVVERDYMPETFIDGIGVVSVSDGIVKAILVSDMTNPNDRVVEHRVVGRLVMHTNALAAIWHYLGDILNRIEHDPPTDAPSEVQH